MQTNDHLIKADRVVGLKQSLRLIRRKQATKILLAADADDLFKTTVYNELSDTSGVEIDASHTAAELAEMEGIAVPVSVITVGR